MKRFSYLVMVVVLSLSTVMNTWAQTDYYDMENAEEATIVNLKVQDDEVSLTGIARGQLISSVELDLTNEGLGVAGISAVVLCHEAMRKIRLRLTLEKFSNNDWVQINQKEFQWTDDEVEGDLAMAAVSYNVGALFNGEYRLRANVSVRALDSSMSEAMTSRTPGLVFK